MIRMLVDQFHVSTPNKVILRSFYDRLKKTPKNMTLENREERKRLYRHVLEIHRENQELYYAVMTGRF